MAPTQSQSQSLAAAWLGVARSAMVPHVARTPADSSSDGGGAAAAAVLSRRDLTVNDAQKVTLGVIAAYVVAIALLWNLPYVRWVLWPFKVLYPLPSSPPSLVSLFPVRTDRPTDPMLTRKTTTTTTIQMLVIAFHEFGHAITCVLTGGRVKAISLDPREGGVTHMQGGRDAVTLPAGYLGSSLIGALLTFAGFNIIASKIASLAVGVCFLLTLWWGRRDWLTLLTVLAAVGLLVACWFIAHAEALKYVVLFIGVMSSLYSVWDIVSFFFFSFFLSVSKETRTNPREQCDDLILRKVNSSDASVFAKRYGGSSQCWGVIWSIISLGFMVAGIIAGIAAFPQSAAQQREDSQKFIPTRF